MNDNEKIIWYLTYAKTQLDKECEAHINAIEEIDELIEKIKTKE